MILKMLPLTGEMNIPSMSYKIRSISSFPKILSFATPIYCYLISHKKLFCALKRVTDSYLNNHY